MRRLALKLAAVAVGVGIVAAGTAGAYSYAQDYNLHRGFTTIVQFRRAGRGRLEQVHFYSRALRRNAGYLVYLPPAYSPSRRYPVYYLLHGAPGQPRVWVDIANLDIRLDNQLSLGHLRPMILVYPDGRIGGSTLSDSEWANTSAGNFESYVIDVMHNVDQRFATIPRRQDRVIAGFSAGAYGAMNIALHHLSDFASVQSWSGYFTQTPSGVFAHASRATLAYNSPIQYIGRLHAALARNPLRVYMFVGRNDSASVQQLPMVRALLGAGAQVQYRFYRGGHDWSVWFPRLDQMLELASREISRPPRAAVIGRLPPAAAAPAPAPVRHHRHRRSELGLIGALLLGLLSAALINLGFVLQHRGHDRASRRGRAGVIGGLREPVWLLGQATGWLGFAGQIVAVALAPLTLVQAFNAGSLALSVPLAARLMGYRVTRRQLVPIALIAVSLGSLPLGFGSGHGHLEPGLLIAVALLVMLAGGLLTKSRGAAVLAVTAGVFYGTADGAIKAASVALRFHGGGVLTGWTVLACLCTLGGFVAFQAALRHGDAVVPLTLMNAFTALVAIVLGIAAFGEPLGSGPVATLLHAAAIIAVIACVAPLADAQLRLAGGADPADLTTSPPDAAEVEADPAKHARLPRPLAVSPQAAARGLGGALVGTVVLTVGALMAIGLLYELRQLRLLGFGPRVADALPLLQLAGFDAQPIARLLVASLAAGLVLGLALIRIDRRRRFVVIGVVGLLLTLVGSDASYALARNLRFGQVLLHHAPGLGAWLEAVALAGASALPGPSAVRIRLPALHAQHASRRVVAAVLASVLGAVALVALVAPTGHARAQAPAQPYAPRQGLSAVLAAALRTSAAQIHAPAATAAVVACGHQVWAGSTGVLDLSSRRPATNNSLFILNSSAKTFVATMIMQEIQHGQLSLSTPLSNFYPQLPNARRITIKMLLSMTSGLPDYLNNSRIESTISHDPRHQWTVEQVLTGMGTGLGRPKFLPGQGFQYSDTNYIVLGGILEQITRGSLESDFQRLIAGPLGLTAATWVPTPAAKAQAAYPYLRHSDGSYASQWIPGYGVSSAVWNPVFTDGGLAASSLDVAEFANALLGGRLVPPAAVKQMTQIGPGDYGFGIRGRSFDGHSWLGHAGYWAGYQAMHWTDRTRQLTIAIAANVLQPGSGPTALQIWWAVTRAYDHLSAGQASCRA